jgi:hypothetical protein
MTEIADLSLWGPGPSAHQHMTAADLQAELLDGGTPSDEVARITGVYSVLSVYLLAGDGYAVAPSRLGDTIDDAEANVLFFRPTYPGQPLSHVYAHALLHCSRIMAEEIEAEEGPR